MADFKKITRDSGEHKLEESPAEVSANASKLTRMGELMVKYDIPADLISESSTERQTIESIIVANLDGLQRDWIMERYYQQMEVKAKLGGGSTVWRQQLGVIQQSIKAKVALI